jgi:Transposase, Mutator family
VFLSSLGQLLSVMPGMRESYEDWLALARDLIARGLGAPMLVAADGAPGLVKAIRRSMPTGARAERSSSRRRWIAALRSAAMSVIRMAPDRGRSDQRGLSVATDCLGNRADLPPFARSDTRAGTAASHGRRKLSVREILHGRCRRRTSRQFAGSTKG